MYRWQEGARASVLDSPALRELLMDQEEGTAGMDTADMQSAAQAARAAEQAAAPPDTQEPPGQGSAAAGQDAGGDWQGMLARLLEQVRLTHVQEADIQGATGMCALASALCVYVCRRA